MKKSCLAFCFLFHLASGQELNLTGRYVSGNKYVNISDTALEFFTSSGGCLVYDIYGFGKYELRNDSIYVTTGDTMPGKGSYYLINASLEKANQVVILFEDNDTVTESFNLRCADSASKIGTGPIPGPSGSVRFENLPTGNVPGCYLHISSLGFDRYSIPLKNIIGKNIRVHLAPYLVLRNRQVAFISVRKDNQSALTGPVYLLTEAEKKEGRKHKRKVRRQVMTHEWPWNWHFKELPPDPPTVFVKQ